MAYKMLAQRQQIVLQFVPQHYTAGHIFIGNNAQQQALQSMLKINEWLVLIIYSYLALCLFL